MLATHLTNWNFEKILFDVNRMYLLKYRLFSAAWAWAKGKEPVENIAERGALVRTDLEGLAEGVGFKWRCGPQLRFASRGWDIFVEGRLIKGLLAQALPLPWGVEGEVICLTKEVDLTWESWKAWWSFEILAKGKRWKVPKKLGSHV